MTQFNLTQIPLNSDPKSLVTNPAWIRFFLSLGMATTQLQSDWNEIVTTAVDYIKNKPTALPPNGSAGGDLLGAYPNPTVAQINGTVVSSGTFTLTGTGFSGTVTTTGRWTLTNQTVTLEIDVATGTSNATTFTLTGLPAALTPARTQYFQVYLQDNGTGALGGIMTVSGTTLSFGKVYPYIGGFTSSGTKGNNVGFTITYNLL